MTMIQELEISTISENPLNPRKSFNQIDDLANDIRQRGVLQPVLVRPSGDGYELIFGARRLRAAAAAGLEKIPSMVKELGDQETLEAMLVENCQRDDIHPLEESDAYRILREEYGRSVEEIADTVGRTTGYVYSRMSYSGLCEQARTLFLANELTATTARLLTRIADAERQAKAAKEVSEDVGDGPMTHRQAAWHVRNNYMLELKSAPFKTDDAELVPDAGACGTCPKRTGNQGELFDEADLPDLCTDVDCFNEKRNAQWGVTKALAKERGLIIIDSKKTAKELFYFGKLVAGGIYVELSDKCIDDPKRNTYRALLQDSPVQKFMARDEGGSVHELVEKKGLKGALIDAGHTWARDVAGETSLQAERRKERAKVELERRTAAAVAEKVVAKATELELGGTDEFWRLVARSAIRSVFPEKHKAAAARRGLVDKRETPENALFKQAAILSGGALRALALEVIFSPGIVAKGTSLHEAADHFGVDVKTIHADLRKEMREVERAKQKRKSKKKVGRKKAGKKVAKKGKATNGKKAKAGGKRSKRQASAGKGTDDTRESGERRAS